MTTERFVQIQPLAGTLSTRPVSAHARAVAAGPGKTCGIDVGSTTCKFVLVSHDGQLLAQAYERHNTKQAEKVLRFFGDWAPKKWPCGQLIYQTEYV